MFRRFVLSYKKRLDLLSKRIRNRLPEELIDKTTQIIRPYLAVIIIASFTLIANYAQAAAQTETYNYSEEMMDLSPAEVAQTVSVVGSYTPNVSVDPVTVALAMADTSFIGKPMIAGTEVTAEPQPPEEKRTTTISYTVQNGDTISNIGWKYGLKIATIKYQNNLTSDTIKPGQVLKLPPGDISAAQMKQLAVKPTPQARPGSKSNAYPYGWCTYYVATRRYVPGGWGNARSWLSSARSSGYATGSAPAAGAIVVLNESWLGHVAYVESVSGSSITISEMNYRGWGITSSRTISAYAGDVMGYIY